MVIRNIENFDVYNKTLDDFKIKTSFGGLCEFFSILLGLSFKRLVSLISFLVIALLFCGELYSYLQVGK